jgi:hypothetical protein
MKGSVWSNDLLKLLFNAVPITGIADNASAAPLTILYLSLHSADPGVGGNQSTNEVVYTGYARAAVNRDGTGFTISGQSWSLTSLVAFASCTGGSVTATYFAVGTAAAGAGKVLYSGPVTPSLAISAGVTPELTAPSGGSES